MLRKLLVGLASACLIMVPLTAQALGFGNIKLNSTLNEPLDARIELISPTSSDLDSLNVKLASEGAFTRAGIDRPHFLSGLQFEVVQEGGDPYIKIISRESIREPFVNFLLEFSWDNGRMLREYTMLLDPPGRISRESAPAMAETPVTEEPADTIERYEPQPYSPEPAVPAEPQPMPAEPAPAGADEPAMAEETDEPEVIEVAPATDELAAEEAWKTSDAFVDDGSLFPRIDISGYRSDVELGELDYGVTKEGDNAWTIAEKLQSNAESASIYQIMMALLQSNPEAFIEGNIHRLKSGQVLRIEDPSLLDAMNRQQAANEYMAQTESWNEYRQAMAERTGRQAVVAEAGAVQAPVRADNGGELTLSSPDGDDLQAGAGASEEAMSNDLVALQDEMRQLRENATSTRERNVELNRQLQEMEEELARLQRSVSVKDDELAALQQQLAELNAVPETPAAEEETATEAEERVEPQPAEEANDAEPAMPREEAEAEAEADMAPQPEAQLEPAPPQASQEPAQPETPTVEEEPQAASAPQTDSEPKGMVEEYLTMARDIFNSAVGVVGGMIGASGNSLLMYVAAPVLLVLVILMLIVVRRRRQAEGNYQESILSGGPSTVTSGTDSTDTGESSFLSDFAVSGAGAIQTEDSEVDPLTEADVFMAYGRYEAAEERLQEAIEQEPGRKELKLKLLELYSATGNSNAFENLAEEFYASLGGEAESDPQWEKVVAMGKELAPNNPLFAAGAAAAAAAPNLGGGAASSGLSDSQVMDIGLDTGVFENSDFAGAEQTGGADSELDFNLDFGTESDTAAAASEENAGGMDFNLDMGSEAASSESQADAGSDLDFNLDMGSEETAGTPAESDAGGMDFNLGEDDTGGGLDFNLGGAEEAGGELDFNLGGDEGDTRNDLEFNLDSGAESPDTETELSLDLDSGTEASSEQIGGLDFNLGDEDNTLSLDTGSDELQGGEEEQTMAIDAGDLDFGAGDQGGMDLNLDASDAADSEMSLGGGDEVGTKLDLARAYIDMGDPDGARSIL
ncbi:MAG: FimV/HubP family polar landmark protein, partial [Pseudomonadota bacterium]